MRRAASIVRSAFSAGFAIILGAAAVTLVAIYLLSLLGVARFVPVLSNSMAPDMPMGSLAITSPVARQEVDAGDVIVFTAPDGTSRRVIHRVEHVYRADEAATIEGWSTERLFIGTRGDNNPRSDPWIVTISDATIWREHAVVPAIGWPTIWLGDPRIRIALFFVAGAAVVTWIIVTIWRRDPAPPEEPGT